MSVTELIHGWKEIQAALPGYEEAEDAYEGKREEYFADQRIQQKIGASGERYRFNLAKTPVNVLARKLELVSVTSPGDGGKSVTSRITEIWDANDMDVYHPATILMALEYGDAYLMRWESAELDDSPITPLPDDAEPDEDLTAIRVELTLHNPKNSRMVYDPENHRRKWFFIKRWSVPRENGKVWRADLYFRDRIERYVSLKDSGCDRADGWEEFTGWPDGDEEAPVLTNPFGEVPFAHYRTALPYGIPVHRDAYPAQDALNKALITLINSLDTQGWPARFALTEPGAELDQNGDDPDFPSGDDSRATTETGRSARQSNLRAGPGTLNYLPGVKELVELAGADPDKFLTPAEFFLRLMAQTTDVPMHHFDPNGEVPSGESLKVKDRPLNKAVQRLQKLFKAPELETWRGALAISGMKVATPLEIRWSPVDQATGKDDWETVGLKQGAGVPTRQTLVEAGYEPETVDGWLDDEHEAMALPGKVAILDTIASAMQKLAAAASLGVIQPEQIQELFSKVTGLVKVPVEGPPEPEPTGGDPAKDKPEKK